MNTFVQEIEEHLKTRLIPFWESLKDQKYGGYYGWLGYDLKLDKEYEKGCILNSRILWFFSSAYELLKEKNLNDALRFVLELVVPPQNLQAVADLGLVLG